MVSVSIGKGRRQERAKAASGPTGIPEAVQARFEAASRLSFEDVRVHYNSSRPAQLGAYAYTRGSQVYIGPGQERHLEHELGHVIQQKRGLVKADGYINSVPVNRDPGLERAADLGANQPVQGFWKSLGGVAQMAPPEEEEEEEEEGAEAVGGLPQGIEEETFIQGSRLIRETVGHISDNIVVQGSRASGKARGDSDIDIAIRVPPDRFDKLIQDRFKTPNKGSAKEKTMLHAIETGKIHSGEAGLRNLRKHLEEIFKMEVDISIIKINGPFDRPPFIPIR